VGVARTERFIQDEHGRHRWLPRDAEAADGGVREGVDGRVDALNAPPDSDQRAPDATPHGDDEHMGGAVAAGWHRHGHAPGLLGLG